MREIKFRAWDKKSKYMFDVRSFQSFQNDRYECMQYTGRKDKNDKELFDGDVIQYRRTQSTPKHQGRIYWGVDGWFVDHLECEQSPLQLSAALMSEVVGNIYENPELLK